MVKLICPKPSSSFSFLNKTHRKHHPSNSIIGINVFFHTNFLSLRTIHTSTIFFPQRGTQSLFHYSSAASTVQPDLMVDYFVNKLGFSRDDAVSASSKLSHLKSTKNCDLVLDLFKRYGFDDTQITNLVAAAPQVLLHNAHKTLEPKFRAFQEISLSGSDLVSLIKKKPYILSRSLDGNINFLRNVLGSDEKVVKAIMKSEWLLTSTAVVKRMHKNVDFLQKCGISEERIEYLIMQYPRVLLLKTKFLRDIVTRVEGELGIPRDSNIFYRGILLLSKVSKQKLETRFGIFRSFGWSDSDIYNTARTQPFCLTLSEARIRAGLQFFMQELGYTPAYLVSHSVLLMLSLEKRVKPRHAVFEILRNNELLNSKACFFTVVRLTELEFLERFLLPYKDQIPGMYESYVNRLK